MRVHGTTRHRPAEVFAELEAPLLLRSPDERYRVPAWSEAKVQRDFHVRAGNAFYSVPHALIGQQVTVRADGTLVKIYHRGQVVRTHPQQPAGGRASDPADFPPGTDVCARRAFHPFAAPDQGLSLLQQETEAPTASEIVRRDGEEVARPGLRRREDDIGERRAVGALDARGWRFLSRNFS
jgi:hypothetical protein